jgi:cell division initiation protein
MDLSPKLFSEIRFREQWRGYNPEEVDEFLKRVAAGLEEMQSRLAEAMERASNAEHRLLERSDEDEVRRTLVLAQRTAVTAMEEARTEADRMVSETEARCRQLVTEAEQQAAKLEVEINNRRRSELGDLAEQRAALQLDIDTLRTFVDDERHRLSDALRFQLDWFENGYRMAEPPVVSSVVATEPVAEMRAAPIVEPELREPEPDPAPEPEPELEVDPVDELRLARAELSDALRRAGVEPEAVIDEPDRAFAPLSAAEAEHAPSPIVEAKADDEPPLLLQPVRPPLFDDATGAYDVLTDDAPAADAAADHEPEDEVDDVRWKDDEDDDPFLAELRRAVVDTEPLGPRDHEAPLVHDLGDDSEPSGGFFRRGRRR